MYKGIRGAAVRLAAAILACATMQGVAAPDGVQERTIQKGEHLVGFYRTVDTGAWVFRLLSPPTQSATVDHELPNPRVGWARPEHKHSPCGDSGVFEFTYTISEAQPAEEAFPSKVIGTVDGCGGGQGGASDANRFEYKLEPGAGLLITADRDVACVDSPVKLQAWKIDSGSAGLGEPHAVDWALAPDSEGGQPAGTEFTEPTGTETVFTATKADAYKILATSPTHPTLTATFDVTIVKVELGMSGVANTDKITVGGFVPINANNDNGSDWVANTHNSIPTTRDLDADNYTDNDLVQISLNLEPTSGLSGTLRLRKVEGGRDRIKIWETTGKVTEVALPKTWTVGTDAIPATLQVEGVLEGKALREIDLILEYLEGGIVVCTDKVKLTVTPILRVLEATSTDNVPDYLGGAFMYANGGAGIGVAAAMLQKAEVHSMGIPGGELRLVQHVHIVNHLPCGAGVIMPDGTQKAYDFKAPYTGQTLVDAQESTLPFYDVDDNPDPGKWFTDDTPALLVVPAMTALAPDEATQIDIAYEFTIFAVWQFNDASVYFLGRAAWSTRFQGQLELNDSNVVFVPGASNANVGNTIFTRDNTDQNMAPPSANSQGGIYVDP